MPDSHERIATLENETRHLTEHIADMSETLDTVDSKIDSINQKLNTQRGFIHGILFVVTPVWALLVAFGRELWISLTG